MLQRFLKKTTQVQLQRSNQLVEKKDECLFYSSPKVHSLGSLDQVQADYQGNYIEGPNSWYFYG